MGDIYTFNNIPIIILIGQLLMDDLRITTIEDVLSRVITYVILLIMYLTAITI